MGSGRTYKKSRLSSSLIYYSLSPPFLSLLRKCVDPSIICAGYSLYFIAGEV